MNVPLGRMLQQSIEYFYNKLFYLLDLRINIVEQYWQIDLMGGSESKNIQEQAFISEHPYFSDAKLVTSKEDGSKTIQARFKVQNEQYDQWNKLHLEGTSKMHSDYLLLPEKTNYKHDTGLCGNTGTLTNTYPNYPYTLAELIKQRHPERRLFKESELWYVLYALTAAKHDIAGRAKKLGDIKPENVFVNQDGKVRIASQFSWPDELPSFFRALDLEKTAYNGLLAPEDLGELQRGALENDANGQSEIFAIGATVLSAGILGNFSSVYNYKTKTFNTQAFRDLRKTWALNDRYSQIFKAILLNLLDSNPGQRLTERELWDFVSQFSVSILEKKQFVITTVPGKVERAFAALRSGAY